MEKILRRTPEPILVMNEKSSVESYDNQGVIGALRAVYLIGADIISATFPREGNCLDIGCGTGQFTVEYAKRIPDLKIDAFDLSPRMIKLAKVNLKRSKSDNISNVNFQIGDISQLEKIKPNQYDAVVSSYVLHHTNRISNAIKIMKNINRILKPNGALYIFDLVRPNLISEFDFIKYNFLINLPEVFRIDTIQSIKSAYNKSEINVILTKSGLENMKTYFTQRGVLIHKKYNGIKSKFIPSSSLKNFNKYPINVRQRYKSGLDELIKAGFNRSYFKL